MLKPTTHHPRGGTSLQGYVDCSYAELVQKFGPPNAGNDGYKTDAEWLLVDGSVTVTIYNYKDGPNYCGSAGTPVEQIRDWHIGGVNGLAVDAVRRAGFSNTRKGW